VAERQGSARELLKAGDDRRGSSTSPPLLEGLPPLLEAPPPLLQERPRPAGGDTRSQVRRATPGPAREPSSSVRVF
jgi:hypothetical protein